MTTVDRKIAEVLAENEELRLRLEEAEETLRAIRSGEVDALVVASPEGERVYTLIGADYSYRVLVESMNEGAAILAPDGTIVYCNRVLADMLKVPFEKIIGLSFSQFLGHAGARDFASLLVDCAEGSKGEMEVVSAGGQIVPVLISCSGMEVADSRGLCMIVTDLSAQKQAHQEFQSETVRRLKTAEALHRSEQMLMHQGRQAAMGEMIGNIAHQWRQPLNTLGLLVQELQMRQLAGRFDEDLLEGYCRRSMETIMHMSKTIDDFRNFFRTDREKTRFSVREVLQRAISLIEGTFKQNQIEILFEGADDGEVYGYPNEYAQVLLNVLLNARDALIQLSANQPRQVTVSVSTEQNRTVVLIADNAGGIAEEILDRIFDPYFTTKGPDKGTGVGLFMSKTIIEKNMHGRITARNREKGAEFRIEV